MLLSLPQLLFHLKLNRYFQAYLIRSIFLNEHSALGRSVKGEKAANKQRKCN